MDQSSRAAGNDDSSTGGWFAGWAKIPLFSLAVLALAASALIVTEDGGAGGGAIHAQTASFQSASGLSSSSSASMAALVERAAQLRQGTGGGVALTADAAVTPGFFTGSPVVGVGSADQALATANHVAASALGSVAAIPTGETARGSAPSGVAAATFPSSIGQTVCPILLATQARVDAQISALIARFPALASQLNATKAQVNAQIGALLAQFGCGISAP